MTTVFQKRVESMSTPAFGVICEACSGVGIRPYSERIGKIGSFCDDCDGVGYLAVDPYEPSGCVSGSTERIARYAARYRSGLPIWSESDFVPNQQDCPEWSGRCESPPDNDQENEED